MRFFPCASLLRKPRPLDDTGIVVRTQLRAVTRSALARHVWRALLPVSPQGFGGGRSNTSVRFVFCCNASSFTQ